MNEKITKKAGEAFAFAQVLQATCAANSSVVEELLGGAAGDVAGVSQSQMDALQAVCDAAGTADILAPKVEKTAAKITKMGEMYVGDDWDDAAEVLEWLSFFVGGAVVHWELIRGAGVAMEHQELAAVASEGVAYYESLMVSLKAAAVRVGIERSAM